VATTVTNAVAESIIDVITTQDVYASLHETDPGETGAGETDALAGRAEILSATGWSAAGDDVATGGRVVSNAAELNWGEATGTANLGWICLWTAAAAGTVLTCTSLVTEQDVIAGNPVVLPIGDLEIVGSGTA
jgi:hypothetical protein